MIVADKLIKNYGLFRAVDDVSFRVEPGEILGFLGPNGAGKSTTMKMITGFLPPSSGTASIGGFDIRSNPIEAKRLLGYLPESGPLYQEMRVGEFLKFAAEVRGLKGSGAERAIDKVTEICHIRSVLRQTIETLSKGYRQRVGLAQTLIHDPACLVLDEPTDGLDPNQKREVRKLIASMSAQKAIILSTHILEEVEAMCSRVIIIAAGKVIADETPRALRMRHPRSFAVQLSVSGQDPEAVATHLRGLKEVKSVETSPDGLLVFPKEKRDLKPNLWELARAQSWSVDQLQDAPVALDEVFSELTQKQAS